MEPVVEAEQQQAVEKREDGHDHAAERAAEFENHEGVERLVEGVVEGFEGEHAREPLGGAPTPKGQRGGGAMGRWVRFRNSWGRAQQCEGLGVEFTGVAAPVFGVLGFAGETINGRTPKISTARAKLDKTRWRAKRSSSGSAGREFSKRMPPRTKRAR